MNAIVKHVIEIAGGIVIGSLASDGLDKAAKFTKNKVKKIKLKKVEKD